MKNTRVNLKPIKTKVKDLRELYAVGWAHQEDGLIEIHENQSSREFLGTAIHEMLHLMFPDLSEAQVGKAEKLMSDTLWKLRFRRVMK